MLEGCHRPPAPRGRARSPLAIRTAAAAALLLGMTQRASQAAPEDAVQQMGAAAFFDTIGVNTHMSADDTGPTGTSYGNVDAVIRELRTIGVKHVRDILLIGPNLSKLRLINQQLGIKFDLVYDDYSNKSGSATLRGAIANVQSAAAIIEAIEGPNEPDQFGIHYNGLTGAPALMKAQADLYRAVKTNPALAAIPVYCPALSYPAPGGLADKLGNLSAVCDAATSHDYVENRSLGQFLPLDYLRRWTSFADKFAGGHPHIITEGGWSTNPHDAEGVDEATQAKYILTYLLDAALIGVERTYLYDLTDDGNDPQYTNNVNHYGLFRYDGTAKPAATMLARLHAILGAGSARPVPPNGHLAFKVTDLPETGHHLLLRRADGSVLIALWNETLLWDRQRHAPTTDAPVRVQVHFGSAASSVQLLDPLHDGPAVDLKLTDDAASVVLPDHPIFLALRPE